MVTATRGLFSRSTLWLVAIAVAVLLAALFAGERWARQSAAAQVGGEARQLAATNASLFDSELQKFRLLPTVLAEYPDVIRLLRQPSSTPGGVNAQLELLAGRTGAAAIYVIAPDGLTLAASNWRLKTSFVGQNYGFRPYFTEALAKGSSELFALGTVSGRPGLFIARRVGPAVAPAGVIVVKIEFDALERAWAQQRAISFVADRHDVVIISARRDWRFRALRALQTAELAEIARTRQFDAQALQKLPAELTATSATINDRAFARAVAPLSLPGARLNALVPIDPTLKGTRARAHLAILALAVLLLGGALWLIRQFERSALQRIAQRELETRVLERTAELRDANDALVREAGLRQKSEEKFRRSREELAQANRLATMGQVAAGVAHEINQPVAAIRTFAENAKAFLGRNTPERADANLTEIVGLTERIAQITGELRNFARRRTVEPGPIALDETIDAALLLVHHRIVGTGTSVVWDRPHAALTVHADRVRLEQVFVNLIQNALDAMEGRSEPQIGIVIAPGDDRTISVYVADNGGGVPKAVRGRLFTPFATGREDGLGLGLAIAHDILREFGGELSLSTTGRSGSTFRIRLRAA